MMYKNGRGVTQSDIQAVYWYRLAESQGDKKAKAALEAMKTRLLWLAN